MKRGANIAEVIFFDNIVFILSKNFLYFILKLCY